MKIRLFSWDGKGLLVILLSFLVGQGHALELNDITDKTKPVYTDLPVTASHQYYIGTIFDSLSNYLCSINQARYDKHANFMFGLEGSVVAYRVQGDEPSCNMARRTHPQLARASQPTPDSDMVFEQWSLGGVGGLAPLAVKARITEEASEENPFGILEMNMQVLSSAADPETIFRFRSASAYTDSSTVDVKVAMFLDQVIVDNTIDINTVAQFFSASLEHNLDNSGEGTIVAKFFSPSADPRIYPEGVPIASRAINVAYNSELLRYRVSADYYSSIVGDYTRQKLDEGDFCVRRSNPWSYVDRFGIYDSEGNQNTESFTATYTDENGMAHNLDVRGMDFSTKMVCRAWSDGAFTDGGSCSGIISGIAGGLLRSVEPPNYAEIIRNDDDGSQSSYLVRRLLTRLVYEQVVGESCASITLPETKVAPNHLFFTEESQLDFSWPMGGAVLVNAFEDDPDADPKLGGAWFRPWEDSDKDGVLNYLDAFPDDATKSADIDNDGIDDSEDGVDNRIVYDHSDIYLPDAIEVITPSMAQP